MKRIVNLGLCFTLSLVLIFGSVFLSPSVVNVALAVNMPDAPITQDTVTAGNDRNDDNEDDEEDEVNEQNDDDQEDASVAAGGDSDNDGDSDVNSETTSKDAPVTTDTISDKKPKCPKGQEVALFSNSCKAIGDSASPTTSIPTPTPTPMPAQSDEDCEINQEKVLELNLLCNIPILGVQKGSQCGGIEEEVTEPEVTGTNPILDPQSNNCVNAPIVDHPSTSDSQTPSQANDCDSLPIWCQSTASQIQEDDNSPGLSSEQSLD
jgi:hypothetical protein